MGLLERAGSHWSLWLLDSTDGVILLLADWRMALLGLATSCYSAFAEGNEQKSPVDVTRGILWAPVGLVVMPSWSVFIVGAGYCTLSLMCASVYACVCRASRCLQWCYRCFCGHDRTTGGLARTQGVEEVRWAARTGLHAVPSEDSRLRSRGNAVTTILRLTVSRRVDGGDRSDADTEPQSASEQCQLLKPPV
ncbi:hypothetical protein N7541_002571 [Penicillium brevicompactum]|uniref:Uncharacterized protein n=1 Tax=Penicillium brevicompactum TaxID=5074 RepID=A0A9W9RKC0_PENBR|nr:hypothetical protein N7541_002571 [Penicillium brevicompactum]